MGRPRAAYEETAAEIDELVCRLGLLLWGSAA
jgi:hypothetical protein